jgi:LysM repeat protein
MSRAVGVLPVFRFGFRREATGANETVGRLGQIAVLLFAGSLLAVGLAGCGGYSMFEPDASFISPGKQAQLKPGVEPAMATDPATTGSTSDTVALTSLFARAANGKLANDPAAPVSTAANPVAVADAGDTAVPAALPPAAGEKITEPRGRAYLFRGVAGLIYSRGMDKLAERIKHVGVDASVDTYLVWRGVADQAIRDYRRDPEPIALIGHSMGGDSALDFAEALNGQNIPVSLLVTYDPSRIADDVPPNVERYINIYQSSNFMGGGNVVQGARFHGHYASYNLKDHSEIVHINIEKTDRLQEQLVAKVAQLAGTPAIGQGEAVPLRLQVPADASIELWDSGLPVQAHAGDTLKALAATYHVPLWAIAQANPGADGALTEGQRIVVPRYLAPTAAPSPVASAVTSYAPVGR